MKYFLKKSKLKNGIYLQIYESYYDAKKKYGAHRSYKALGYVEKLKAQGIEDPIAFYTEEVKRLNGELAEEKEARKAKQISEETPEKLAGYFPIKGINESINVKGHLDLMQSVMGFKFNLYEMISALIYARVVQPCSKLRTYSEVLPKLAEKYDFSLGQIYDGLGYIGSEYEKVIEIYKHQLQRKYTFKTDKTYFDCTNFYFEIDREDDFRRKGPSKENRHEPIVGLGLLLDANQIPIGMKMYPGNESEKPVMRDIIDGLKKTHGISGRTITVADKGLNCANNIVHALLKGDGYLFSKSVKTLPEKEKVWVLLENDYKEIKDAKGKVLYKIKECVDDFEYTVTDVNGKPKKVALKEKRIATYNPDLAQKQLHEIDREIEKAQALKLSQAKKSEFGDCSKYVNFVPADKKGTTTDGKVVVTLNETAIAAAKDLAGYNLLVTSEISMPASEIYSTYHNLWRIEESFRIMKSELDARPVYLQKKETITGHFLICFLAVLLVRIFQFKILDNKNSSSELFGLFRDFKVVKIAENEYINLSRRTSFIETLAEKTGLPLLSFYFKQSDLNHILSFKF